MPVECLRVFFWKAPLLLPYFLCEAAKICGQLRGAGQDMLRLLFSIRNKQMAPWENGYLAQNVKKKIIKRSGHVMIMIIIIAMFGPLGCFGIHRDHHRQEKSKRQDIQRDYFKRLGFDVEQW